MSREPLRAAAAAEVDRWERRLAIEVDALFDRQQAVVLARLQGTKARKHTRHWDPAPAPGLERKIDARYVVEASRWVRDTASQLKPLVGRMWASVFGRVSSSLGNGGAVPDPQQVEAALQARLDAIIAGMETAVAEVSVYVTRADEAGEAMPAIVSGVKELYEQRKPTWVERITVLSAVGTINHAAMSAAINAGSPSKQWLSRRDDRVRDTHEHADGQIVPILRKFKLGGIPSHPARSELMFPGDPDGPLDEVINCRCTLLFAPAPVRPKGVGPSAALVRRAMEAGLVVALAGDGESAVAAALEEAGSAAVGSQVAAGRAAAAASRSEPPPEGKAEADLEVKDKVRTEAGARQFGQPIGATIRRDVVPTFSSAGAAPSTPRPSSPPRARVLGRLKGGGEVALVGDDPAVRRQIARHAQAGNGDVPDEATTEVLALRDRSGKVGAYVVWQTEDGPQPKGTVVSVSVAPALRGQRVGDQLLAIAAKHDRSLQVTSRPASSPAPARARPAAAPAPARAKRGTIIDRSKPGDAPGTTGDFDADSARIERLQKAYMRDGVDTSSLFSKGGRWTRERERAQQEVIDHFLSKPGVKKGQKILVLGGLPGSGKTTTINSASGQAALGIDLDEYVTVNADEVKDEMVARGMVPNYPGLAPEEAATLFHAESFEIAHSLMRQAAKRKLNFAYDTSLKSASQVGFATSAGARTMPPPWETTLVFVDVPPAVAKQRAKERYLGGGRYMPLGLIDGMRSSSRRFSSGPAEQFSSAKRQADRWVVFDNAGAAPVVADQGGRSRRRPAQGPSAAPVAAPAAPVAAPAPAVTVPAALPTPPAGARVYRHPQGKHIYVLPDGSMQVFKPDGKRASSSATPAKLAAGYGGWTELTGAPDGPPLAATPAPSTGTKPKLVASPAAPPVAQAGTPAPAGAMPVTPMDFNEAPLADVPKYIADPNFVFQQKVDGIRGVLVVEPGRPPWFASKKGDRLQSSTAAKITDPMLKKLPPTPAGSPAYRVEGELLNGKFHVFDMTIVGQESTPYEQREQMAAAWVKAVQGGLPQAEMLPTARTAKEKQALWDAVVNSGAEGVMMKRRDAGYQGGARVSHTLKAKITATADVVVVEKGVGGKDNARIALLHGGKVTPIGTISTLGKGPISVGDVVEVEYLWATANNTLAQPRILRRRPDKNVADITDSSQLRLVDKTVLPLQAKRLRLRLERAMVGV